MRKFVIADIRGELTLLEKLLQKLGPTRADQLIFTGSYLGPGPDSKAVLDYILNLNSNLLPNMVFLGGCYEYVFGECIGTRPNFNTMQLWGNMGGRKVFESYQSKKKIMIVKNAGSNGHPVEADVSLEIPESHMRFMGEKLSHGWFTDDVYPYIVSHAGGHPLLMGGNLSSEEELVFSYRDWWEEDGKRIPGRTVIFSHYPFKKPFQRAGKIGLDLGAGLGGKLCAFEMFEQKFTQVG